MSFEQEVRNCHGIRGSAGLVIEAGLLNSYGGWYLQVGADNQPHNAGLAPESGGVIFFLPEAAITPKYPKALNNLVVKEKEWQTTPISKISSREGINSNKFK